MNGRKKSGRLQVRIWTLLLCLIYPLVASGTLKKETSVVPSHFNAFSQADSRSMTRGASSTFPASAFRTAARAGYADAEGAILWAQDASDIVAIDDSGWASKRPEGGFDVRNPNGAQLFGTEAGGYPFFRDGRKFVLREDQRGVSEIGDDGRVLWTSEFSSLVTSFSSGRDVAAFGLLDGSIRLFGSNGSEAVSLVPGGSRLSCIYALAVSQDGKYIGALSGQDPQRLVVYRKSGIAYAPYFSKSMERSSVRPLAAGFSADGSTLLSAAGGGIAFFRLEDNRFRMVDTCLPGADIRKVVPILDSDGTVMVLESAGDRIAVSGFTSLGTEAMRFSFAGPDADLIPSGSGFALVLEDGLYRYGLERR